VEGIVEAIDGVALSTIKGDRPVLEYLCRHNPDCKQPLGIAKGALDRYTKSTAFGCVFCYVFGVQDRHLDNILLCTDGTLVHIDFSFLLGADPKGQMSCPIRVTRDMADGMGGERSAGFEEFQMLCCIAYNALRRSSLELFVCISSFVDSGVPGLTGRDNRSALQFIENRLQLHLNGMPIIYYLLSLLHSLSTMPCRRRGSLAFLCNYHPIYELCDV
jgi:phosphatidylinositol 3-kinase